MQRTYRDRDKASHCESQMSLKVIKMESDCQRVGVGESAENCAVVEQRVYKKFAAVARVLELLVLQMKIQIFRTFILEI